MSTASRLEDTPWTPDQRRYWSQRLPHIRIPDVKPVPRAPSPRVAAALRTCKQPPALAARIVFLCAEATGVPVAAVVSGHKSRRENVVRARKAAAYLIYQRCPNHNYGMIATRLGLVNGTSVKTAIEQVESDIELGGEHFGAILAYVEEALTCTE